MEIRQSMCMSVPASNEIKSTVLLISYLQITRRSCPCIPKAEIKTSQEGDSVINDKEFLVMSPEKCSTSSVVRMSLDYTRKACQLLNTTHFTFICQSKKIWTHQQCFCSNLPTMSLYAHYPKSRLVQLPVGECSLEKHDTLAHYININNILCTQQYRF